MYRLEWKAVDQPDETGEAADPAAEQQEQPEGRQWAGDPYEDTDYPAPEDSFAHLRHPDGSEAWLEKGKSGDLTGWVRDTDGQVYRYTDMEAWIADVDGAQMTRVDNGPTAETPPEEADSMEDELAESEDRKEAEDPNGVGFDEDAPPPQYPDEGEDAEAEGDEDTEGEPADDEAEDEPVEGEDAPEDDESAGDEADDYAGEGDQEAAGDEPAEGDEDAEADTEDEDDEDDRRDVYGRFKKQGGEGKSLLFTVRPRG